MCVVNTYTCVRMALGCVRSYICFPDLDGSVSVGQWNTIHNNYLYVVISNNNIIKLSIFNIDYHVYALSGSRFTAAIHNFYIHIQYIYCRPDCCKYTTHAMLFTWSFGRASFSFMIIKEVNLFRTMKTQWLKRIRIASLMMTIFFVIL